MEKYITSTAYACVNNRIYISANDYNGLISCGINSYDTKLETRFCDSDIRAKYLHKTAIVFKGIIYFFPDKSNLVHAYDTNNKSMASYFWDESIKDVIIDEDTLWILGGKNSEYLFEVDVKDLSVRYKTKIVENSVKNIRDSCVRLSNDKDIITIGQLGTNRIIKYSKSRKSFNCIETKIKDIFEAYGMNNKVWITDRHSPIVYCVYENNIIKEYLPDIDLSYVDKSFDYKRYYNRIYKLGNSIVFVPAIGDSIVTISNDSIMTYKLGDHFWKQNTPKFISGLIINNILYLFSSDGNTYYKIAENGNIECKKGFEYCDYISDHDRKMQMKYYMRNEYCNETVDMCLKTYLEFL